MKTIKQIISDADPRLKGVLMIMIVYVMVMATTVTSGATQEIKGYKETIEIQYQDGSQEAKDYLVRQDTVKNVLKELDVNLGTKDTVNKDMAYIVQSKDLLQVNRISEEEVEEIQYVDSQTIETTGLHLFTTEVVQQGQRGQIKNKVKVTYENGKIVKKELLSSEVVTEKTDTIIAHGTIQPGAYFTGKLTTYGGDCAGGNGTAQADSESGAIQLHGFTHRPAKPEQLHKNAGQTFSPDPAFAGRYLHRHQWNEENQRQQWS